MLCSAIRHGQGVLAHILSLLWLCDCTATFLVREKPPCLAEFHLLCYLVETPIISLSLVDHNQPFGRVLPTKAVQTASRHVESSPLDQDDCRVRSQPELLKAIQR